MAFASLFTCISAMAQEGMQVPQLPQDEQLVTGKLDNGLTYYIRHNETPKGQADFYIAQKVGSILENEEQRGLAHFLEHMCFNGTQNFPDKGIINYLESVGVKFGYNLNAYTSIDETVYNISSVPVARQSVQDSCLLILHDWSCALTLAPEEIDAERGVIHEEWRQAMVGQMRIIEQALPALYPDNKYGYRLPIGTMEVVDNFPYQALIDYYHKWYRPDQQAIIVVGDIDPVYIENKIKELFSPIAMPENAAERTYLEVEDTPGTLYAIGSDPEMQNPTALMFFKNDNVLVPMEYRNTQIFFVTEYFKRVISIMLNNRLQELSKDPDCLYAHASIDLGEYFVSKTKGALELDVVSKGNDIVAALMQAYREILRADRTGFTVGEYERARTEFLSQIDNQFQQRNNRETASYSREYVKLFTEGIPAPGIETEKQLFDAIGQMIDVAAVNQYFQSLVQEDNRAVLVMMPRKAGYTDPTEEQLAEAFDNIDNEELEAYKDEVREDPLIPNLPAKGSVVGTRTLDEWGATEYTLSNGVKVVVKPTDFKANEIVFEAMALGKGTSTLSDDLASDVLFSDYAMSVSGINDYSNLDMQKYLAGKQVELSFDFNDYNRSLSGTSTVGDLPTFMEMLYGYFTGLNIKENEFAAQQNAISSMLANQESNPQFVFLKEVRANLCTSPMEQMITPENVTNANREHIISIWHNMLANAKDFTFYFTGDINLDTFVPLMEQYIATLPTEGAVTDSYTINEAFEIPVESINVTNTMAMETPQSWVFIVMAAKEDYTAMNKNLASISAQILSKRLLNKIREEMGATYSIGAHANLSRISGTNTLYQIAFPMKPEMKQEALAAIRQIIEEMTSTVAADELNPVIEYMVKNADESLEKNKDWASAMAATQLNGVQTFTNAREVLGTITVDDVQNFMRSVIDQNGYRVIILDPTE